MGKSVGLDEVCVVYSEAVGRVKRINEGSGVVLLRLRGFLHALRLVEMTTRKNTVISSVVERSPSVY